MAEIARQAIAEVAAGAGQSAQGQAQCHARLRLFQARARGLQQLRANGCGPAGEGGIFLQQQLQRQPGIAQTLICAVTDVNAIARTGTAAQQGLCGRHVAKHRDADGQRAARGVAADQLAFMGIGQGKQAGGKGL